MKPYFFFTAEGCDIAQRINRTCPGRTAVATTSERLFIPLAIHDEYENPSALTSIDAPFQHGHRGLCLCCDACDHRHALD